MIPNLTSLDWQEILKQIQSSATSGVGRLKLSELQACQTQETAYQQMEFVFDALEVLSSGSRPFMESLDLFEPWHGRLKRQAVLKAIEIRDVRSFCLEIIALHECLYSFSNNWSSDIKKNLMKADEPMSAIDQIITPRGEIRNDASEKLFQLFNEKENLGRQIQNTLDKLVKDWDMQSYLQDRYVTTREGRWVLPIRSGRQHAMEGVIHGSSQTKQTVFMEPSSIIPLNNRLRQAEVEIEEEVERLLTDLSQYLSSHIWNFTKARDILESADTMFAIAQWTQKIEGSRFKFAENEFFLVDVKHPLMQISQKKPIPNTVQLNQDKSILLLSGPNAGGKTVLLKAIGLAAQMARCGLPICAAEGSSLPFVKDIHIGIGDEQSVDEELSTFAAHVRVLEKGTHLTGFNNLILIDEICGSTDPEEGSALARSFIEKFSENNCFAVITSHLGPLKSGWTPESKVMSGSLEYDMKSGRPTYQFLPGVPGDSLALQTAKRVGVSKAIIDRAVTLLSPTTRTRLAGLEEIEQLKSDIGQLRDQLKKEKNKAQFEQQKYEKLYKELEKEKEHELQRTIRMAEKKIEDLITQSKVEQTFKRHATLQEIKNQLPEIVKSKVGQSGKTADVIQSADDFIKKYPPGSKVFIPSLNQDGIIQSHPNNKGEITVLSNSFRLQVNWKDLKVATQATNPTADLVRRSSNYTVPLVDQERSLDVRGLTVDEALLKIESTLDQAFLQKEDRLKIIHGHGTDTLKKAIRTYLSRSQYVKKWKAGSPEQGGDGITWVEIGEV